MAVAVRPRAKRARKPVEEASDDDTDSDYSGEEEAPLATAVAEPVLPVEDSKEEEKEAAPLPAPVAAEPVLVAASAPPAELDSAMFAALTEPLAADEAASGERAVYPDLPPPAAIVLNAEEAWIPPPPRADAPPLYPIMVEEGDDVTVALDMDEPLFDDGVVVGSAPYEVLDGVEAETDSRLYPLSEAATDGFFESMLVRGDWDASLSRSVDHEQLSASPFYKLLKGYLAAETALTKAVAAIEKVKETSNSLLGALWSQQHKKATHSERCACGNMQHASLPYKQAVVRADVRDRFADSLNDLLQRRLAVTGVQLLRNYAFMKVESYVGERMHSRLVMDSVALEMGSAPVIPAAALTELHDMLDCLFSLERSVPAGELLPSPLLRMTTCPSCKLQQIMSLYAPTQACLRCAAELSVDVADAAAALERPAGDGFFRFHRSLRAWLTNVAAALLRLAAPSDRFVLLYHLTRTPGVGDVDGWAVPFLQLPALPSTMAEPRWGAAQLDEYVRLLRVLLTPVSAKDEPEAADAWVIVEDAAGRDYLLSEEDFIALMQQLPHTAVFAQLFHPLIADEGREAVSHALSRALSLLRLFGSACLTFSGYASMVALLAQTVTLLTRAACELMLRLRESMRGQALFDGFALAAADALLESPQYRARLALSDLPLDALSHRAAWAMFLKIYAGSAAPSRRDCLDVSSLGEWLLLLERDASVRESAYASLGGSEDGEFRLLALSRLAQFRGQELARIVVLEIFLLGFVHDRSRLVLYRAAEDQLADICAVHPALVSQVTRLVAVHFRFIDRAALSLFRRLPLEAWRPVDRDMAVLRRWLLTGRGKTESELAQLALSKLNWSSTAGQLLLAPQLHRQAALMVAEAFSAAIRGHPLAWVVEWMTAGMGRWAWQLLFRLSFYGRGGRPLLPLIDLDSAAGEERNLLARLWLGKEGEQSVLEDGARDPVAAFLVCMMTDLPFRDYTPLHTLLLADRVDAATHVLFHLLPSMPEKRMPSLAAVTSPVLRRDSRRGFWGIWQAVKRGFGAAYQPTPAVLQLLGAIDAHVAQFAPELRELDALDAHLPVLSASELLQRWLAIIQLDSDWHASEHSHFVLDQLCRTVMSFPTLRDRLLSVLQLQLQDALRRLTASGGLDGRLFSRALLRSAPFFAFNALLAETVVELPLYQSLGKLFLVSTGDAMLDNLKGKMLPHFSAEQLSLSARAHLRTRMNSIQQYRLYDWVAFLDELPWSHPLMPLVAQVLMSLYFMAVPMTKEDGSEIVAVFGPAFLVHHKLSWRRRVRDAVVDRLRRISSSFSEAARDGLSGAAAGAAAAGTAAGGKEAELDPAATASVAAAEMAAGEDVKADVAAVAGSQPAALMAQAELFNTMALWMEHFGGKAAEYWRGFTFMREASSLSPALQPRRLCQLVAHNLLWRPLTGEEPLAAGLWWGRYVDISPRRRAMRHLRAWLPLLVTAPASRAGARSVVERPTPTAATVRRPPPVRPMADMLPPVDVVHGQMPALATATEPLGELSEEWEHTAAFYAGQDKAVLSAAPALFRDGRRAEVVRRACSSSCRGAVVMQFSLPQSVWQVEEMDRLLSALRAREAVYNSAAMRAGLPTSAKAGVEEAKGGDDDRSSAAAAAHDASRQRSAALMSDAERRMVVGMLTIDRVVDQLTLAPLSIASVRTAGLRWFYGLLAAESRLLAACPALREFVWRAVRLLGGRFVNAATEEMDRVLLAMLETPSQVPLLAPLFCPAQQPSALPGMLLQLLRQLPRMSATGYSLQLLQRFQLQAWVDSAPSADELRSMVALLCDGARLRTSAEEERFFCKQLHVLCVHALPIVIQPLVFCLVGSDGEPLPAIVWDMLAALPDELVHTLPFESVRGCLLAVAARFQQHLEPTAPRISLFWTSLRLLPPLAALLTRLLALPCVRATAVSVQWDLMLRAVSPWVTTAQRGLEHAEVEVPAFTLVLQLLFSLVQQLRGSDGGGSLLLRVWQLYKEELRRLPALLLASVVDRLLQLPWHLHTISSAMLVDVTELAQQAAAAAERAAAEDGAREDDPSFRLAVAVLCAGRWVDASIMPREDVLAAYTLAGARACLLLLAAHPLPVRAPFSDFISRPPLQLQLLSQEQLEELLRASLPLLHASRAQVQEATHSEGYCIRSVHDKKLVALKMLRLAVPEDGSGGERSVRKLVAYLNFVRSPLEFLDDADASEERPPLPLTAVAYGALLHDSLQLVSQLVRRQPDAAQPLLRAVLVLANLKAVPFSDEPPTKSRGWSLLREDTLRTASAASAAWAGLVDVGKLIGNVLHSYVEESAGAMGDSLIAVASTALLSIPRMTAVLEATLAAQLTAHTLDWPRAAAALQPPELGLAEFADVSCRQARLLTLSLLAARQLDDVDNAKRVQLLSDWLCNAMTVDGQQLRLLPLAFALLAACARADSDSAPFCAAQLKRVSDRLWKLASPRGVLASLGSLLGMGGEVTDWQLCGSLLSLYMRVCSGSGTLRLDGTVAIVNSKTTESRLSAVSEMRLTGAAASVRHWGMSCLSSPEFSLADCRVFASKLVTALFADDDWLLSYLDAV